MNEYVFTHRRKIGANGSDPCNTVDVSVVSSVAYMICGLCIHPTGKMAVYDLKVICRLCAKEKEFCVDVFGEDGVKNNLSKKIRLCLPVIVSIIQHLFKREMCP
jgi:hypothetical protein